MVEAVIIRFEPISAGEIKKPLDKQAVLKTISDALAKVSGQEVAQIQSAFLERERIGNTTLTSGIVIPHAVLNGRQSPILGIFNYPLGIQDWEDLDGKPVTHVLAILMGKAGITEQEADDIKHFFMALALPNFLQKISDTKQSQATIAVIKQQLEEK
ncbi:PTS sugar transporter subunit IIA [Lacticaseibacillus zeae]|uniref:PTS sugar transporter subunit IIA n=1 Tax=Lacticaseibacillus zeae TaxID=57037 RepID=A0A5R8LNX7_LACZE|nr:PTS sugar transporter subunit IIA [Lacticaseibacillus zeae]TLF38893.1 PTS sugar transporter subunit IIA [Lacticaseibacillus zeae]